VSANLGGQFAQQYIVHEGLLSPPLCSSTPHYASLSCQKLAFCRLS
jgi:hypothetical protein